MEAARIRPELDREVRAGCDLSVPTRILCSLARWARHRSVVHSPADLLRTTDEGRYRAWRSQELKDQLLRHFDVSLIANRHVLDFGCGTGELCGLLASYHPRSIVGLDMSGDAIDRALESSHDAQGPEACVPRFVRNERHDVIPLETDSVDLLCCFDVVEHIPDIDAIVREWRRILREDGRVWIWWSPWRGPFGHHLESLIPLPWIHLLMSEATIFKACAELYDDTDFVPRKWDLDPVSGLKKPNKWRSTRKFHPFLNRMTCRGFERTVAKAGLRIARRGTFGFSGSWLRRATRLLHPLPLIGECFVSHYIYEIVPPRHL